MTRVIAIANHKGGVAKTTTAHALAAELSTRRNARVLVVDCDPQASLTSLFMNDADVRDDLAAVLLRGAPAAGALVAVTRTLALLPSSMALAEAESALMRRPAREQALASALRPIMSHYTTIVLDCPPSLGLLTVNALVAADGVLIPVQPMQTDLRALGQFMATLDQVRASTGARCELIGIVPTMVDMRLRHHQSAVEAISNAGLRTMQPIRRAIAVAQSAVERRSVIDIDPRSGVADDYRALTKQLEQWLKK